MSPHSVQRLRQEADLIHRFVSAYQGRFVSLIDQLNRQPQQVSDLQCLRLCVEAVNMMMSTHDQLAEALRQIAGEGSTRPPIEDAVDGPRETQTTNRVSRRST